MKTLTTVALLAASLSLVPAAFAGSPGACQGSCGPAVLPGDARIIANTTGGIGCKAGTTFRFDGQNVTCTECLEVTNQYGVVEKKYSTSTIFSKPSHWRVLQNGSNYVFVAPGNVAGIRYGAGFSG